MNILLQVNLSCFLLSYLVAFGAEVIQFLRARSRAAHMVSVIAMAAGLVAHTGYLFARFQESGLPPLVGSSHDWLLVLGWLGIVVSLFLTAFTPASQAVFFLPTVLLLVLLAIIVDDTPSEMGRQLEVRRWGMLHASTLMIGIGLVVAATVTALMYLLQYQRLRGRDVWIQKLRLPSLERLTVVNRYLILACLPLLTIGLVTGVILGTYAADGQKFLWSEPIVWGTIAVWLIMILRLVFLLRRRQQTGRTVALRTLFAGGFLVLTVFGLTLVTGGIHGSSGPVSPPANTSSTRP